MDTIYTNLQQILLLMKEKKQIIDLEKIFANMIDIFSNKELNEFCKLNKIIGLLKRQRINSIYFSTFYNKVHKKGMNLIKKNQLTPNEIINFIVYQDIYYYNQDYKNDDNRDPSIFIYLPIATVTDEDRNYLVNIKNIKDKNLWYLFSKSLPETKRKFYNIFLAQMKKIRYFKSIFDIFPRNNIDKDFTFLINEKIRDLIYTSLDEEEKNYDKLFQIFDNWFIINELNSLDLGFLKENLEKIYNITSKYYLYLIQNNDMKAIVRKIKDFIINFYIEQMKRGNNSYESIISLLQCKDNELLLFFLNNLDNIILKEEEFYQIEDTVNFLLFKLFFQKCKDFLDDPKINQGKYLKDSLIIKCKINNDLNNKRVKYNIVNNLMNEDKKLYNKMLVISEGDTERIYNNLKKSLIICKTKFDELEQIVNYYTTFFYSSKKDLIELIKYTLNEFKQKNICNIIECKNFFKDNNNFDLDQAIKERKNIKYKNSYFFMAIYNKYKDANFNKSEGEIFYDTKKIYKDSLKRIIRQKETKEPFFELIMLMRL